MSLLGKSDWLPEAIAALLRTPARIEGEVDAILAHATPLTRLMIKVPKRAAAIDRYHSVRLTMQQLSGQVSRKTYAKAREAVLDIAKSADGRTRRAVERELAAWDQFLEDAGKFKKIVVELPALPAAKLDPDDITLFREFTSDLLRSDEPAARELQDAWRQFIRVVGPDNEAEWAVILKQARKTADNVHGALPDAGSLLAIDQYIGGHLSGLQGKAWEAYARRCLVLLDEIDRAMRAAASRAARLGGGFQPIHVNGELHLASVSEEVVKQIRKADAITPDTPITWKQFADDGVLAVKLPPGGGLADIDAAALMEIKAEGGYSRLGDKLVDFHRRHTQAASGESLFVKYTNAEGKEVVGLLRPPDPTTPTPTAYYAIGTDNTRIPSAEGLSALGIDQRRLNGDLSRDALRQLMSELVHVAASLGKAAP